MEDKAFNTCLVSFSLILLLGVGLNAFELEATLGLITIKAIAGFLILSFLISGLYLWVTGFKRFHETIGNYSLNWLLYVSFTIFAALYLHYVHRNKYKHS